MKKKLLFLVVTISLVLLPSIVHAELNDYVTDGKIVFKSVKPKSFDELMLTYENLFYDDIMSDNGFYITECNDELTKCTFEEGQYPNTTTRELDIVYEYDEDIKRVVDNLISKIPEGKDTFELTEMEVISYLYNTRSSSDDRESIVSVPEYSSELKKYIDYNNFGIDIRLGDDSPFMTARGGAALFTYNGTIYYISTDVMLVESKHYFYIPTDSTDVIKAMKDRLAKNFPGYEFEITELAVDDFLEGERAKLVAQYDDPNWSWLHNDYATAAEYAEATLNNEYLDEDAPYHYVVLEDKCYKMTINGVSKFNDLDLYFLVKKDSSKIVDNELITKDASSNVVVSTKGTIPLDTLIKVSKLTSGEEYDKIIKLLSITDGEMFDLQLFSKSIGNITKLDNGSFEVRLPISEKFKGKNLIVYYVDNNNKVTEYKVTVDGDYAIFETNHFSVYTLAENTTEADEENPKTGDNIMLYISMLLISGLGLGYLKEKHN